MSICLRVGGAFQPSGFDGLRRLQGGSKFTAIMRTNSADFTRRRSVVPSDSPALWITPVYPGIPRATPASSTLVCVCWTASLNVMENVTSTPKEQSRLQVLNSLAAEHATLNQAAEVMGVTSRRARRILADYRAIGAAAFAHGCRGRSHFLQQFPLAHPEYRRDSPRLLTARAGDDPARDAQE